MRILQNYKKTLEISFRLTYNILGKNLRRKKYAAGV